MICVCRQRGHRNGLEQTGRHAGGDSQAVCSALKCEILRGKKWLEDADETESRATFRNEIHLVLVGAVEGWNLMQWLWPKNKIR